MTDPKHIDQDRKVTVCAACLRASCWRGTFFCAAARTANTTTRTVRELIELDLEVPAWWEDDDA